MPFTRISIMQGQSAKFKQRVGDIVYQAMVDTLNVPLHDRFQILTEHDPDSLIYDPGYLGIHRTDGIIFIQLVLNAGRPVELKKAFYKETAQQLHDQLEVRTEDVFIHIIEVNKDNWSYGNGIAQYAI